MDLDDVKNISVYGANCVVDISRGNDDTCSFVSPMLTGNRISYTIYNNRHRHSF